MLVARRCVHASRRRWLGAACLSLAGGCGPAGGPDLVEMAVPVDGRLDIQALHAQVTRDFIAEHGDRFDEVVLFPDHRLSLPGQYFVRLSNKTAGIGIPQFAATADYGSTRLLGVISMGHGWETADLAEDAVLRDRQAPLTLLLHETGHAFSTHLRYRRDDAEAGEAAQAAWLGRQQAHWSFWADTGGSPLGGNDWRQEAPGVFSAHPLRGQGYCDFDLYAMGLLPAAAVAPMTILTADRSACETCDADHAIVDVTIAARAQEVDIQGVLAAEGPRLPASGPTLLRQAWIYLFPSGQAPDSALLRRLRTLQQRWPAHYAAATRKLGEVSTRLLD